MAMEQGLYAQAVVIRQKDFFNKRERKIPRNISFKGNPHDQYAGLVLIMSG